MSPAAMFSSRCLTDLVPGALTPPRWSAAGDLAYLDEAGIDLAVLSISAPARLRSLRAAARGLASTAVCVRT
jgi:hypothetical protein